MMLLKKQFNELSEYGFLSPELEPLHFDFMNLGDPNLRKPRSKKLFQLKPMMLAYYMKWNFGLMCG
ncbi:MAG: hypothetical protein ACJAXX_000781 [Roseivirga sp.]|jgi:hypothetical protein